MAANNVTTAAEEESDDLTACCVCMEVYNAGDRKPKFLSCHHTYCLTCIKKMVNRRPSTQVTCPKCKAVCVLPGEGPEALFTNDLVLSYIQLKNRVKNQHSWCLDCEAIPNPTCEGILDQMEDVEEVESIKAVISVTFSQAIERRQQIEDHLKAAHADNGECLKKLRSLAEKKQLSASKTSTASAKKKLEEVLTVAKEEVEKAERMWNSLNITTTAVKSVSPQPLHDVDYERIDEPTAKKRKISSSLGDGVGRTAGAVLGSYYQFPSVQISAERLSSSQPLCCRGLNGHHYGRAVTVVEFSDDSSLLVSGGRDGRVLLWPTNKATDDKWTPKPIAMDTIVNSDEEVHPSVLCLSMSPDNRRIFSGGRDNNLLIHDANTKKLLNSFQHASQVNGVALQPGKDGNTCVTAGYDGIVRLFDTRQNKKGAVSEVVRSGALFSVMFSPADSTVFAVATEENGAIIYDIRNMERNVYSFPSANGTLSAQFNASGNRLLCFEDSTEDESTSQLVVYDLPTCLQPATVGKVLLIDPVYNGGVGNDACCFAGLEDDLVIGGSAEDGNLFAWSLPDGKGRDCTINRSLHIFRNGHSDPIQSVRCSNDKSTIASCGEDGVIKLWTSGVTR